MLSLPYIVLIGDVGAGKSTLVEKISGLSGISSSSYLSATKSSSQHYSTDKSILICDTPGANPLQEKFEHNLWIANAMNFMPFSSIVIVVKAETRMDNVIDGIRKYAERLLDLADMLAVCVTHMDQVIWDKNEFVKYLNDEMGINKAVFTGNDSESEKLITDLKSICCEQAMDLQIDSKNFF